MNVPETKTSENYASKATTKLIFPYKLNIYSRIQTQQAHIKNMIFSFAFYS
jgi:hypothetical protein